MTNIEEVVRLLIAHTNYWRNGGETKEQTFMSAVRHYDPCDEAIKLARKKLNLGGF